jgi:tetratricopeptide (TPR) repeat protein
MPDGRILNRSIVALSIAGLACTTAGAIRSPEITESESVITIDDIVVDEITGPVEPPGPRVIDAAGERQLGADPDELRAAGHYYYRSGELDRAQEFYAACSARASGQLRAACQWAIGAVLVEAARRVIADGLHEDPSCVRRDPPSPLECTREAGMIDRALMVLRIAHRGHPTARRAWVIGTLYEQLGRDTEALKFYEQGLATDPEDVQLSRSVSRLRSRGPRPECPGCAPREGVESAPRDCPTLPFEWHRRTGELIVVGSELEGSERERVLACFGEPRESTAGTWIYEQSSCTESLGEARRVTNKVRLHFEGDVVEAVTHERIIEDADCALLLVD